MPGYTTHRRVSRVVIIPATFLVTWVIAGGHLRADTQTLKELGTAAIVALGAGAGNTILSPDLDIPSSPYSRWGFLKPLWLGYQILIGHRSPTSHWPVLGAIFQHLWLMTEVILLTFLGICAWNFVLLPHTDLGRVLELPFINVTLKDIATTVCFSLWRSEAYWLFAAGHALVGQPAHCIMDFADSRRRRHYRGQPMRPPEEDERRAVKGKLWED